MLSRRRVEWDDRWHEQDPDQIIQACEDCIDEAVKSLEAAGNPRSSIKVIGTLAPLGYVGKRSNNRRDNEST